MLSPLYKFTSSCSSIFEEEKNPFAAILGGTLFANTRFIPRLNSSRHSSNLHFYGSATFTSRTSY